MSEGAPVRRVLMVCMGNICRSPTAEEVLRHKLRLAGLDDIEVDSAGTHGDWHVGEAPDPRSIRHAARRGYDLRRLRARCVEIGDIERFDLILGMDEYNLARLEEMAGQRHRHKLGLLTQHLSRLTADDVPDPYQGGEAGFEHVLDLIEDACDGLVRKLATQGHVG
jgi:protein-tyrosine phosphatase